MNKIKKGDIVGRKSYNKDIIFVVIKIISNQKEKIALLKGLYERIEADSNIEDLEIIEKEEIEESLAKVQNKIQDRIDSNKDKYKRELLENNKRSNEKIITGKILHLDGDRKYSQKSYLYYRKLGLNSVVKNIPEYKQPLEVYRLLMIYNPDILIVTGHDGMIRKEIDYNNLQNYRNSKYFIETVKKAREYERDYFKDLVIFAGACQSYYEALINAGANFASSPARILIDFLDPLIIAQKVAITESYKYITINDIYKELRDGKRGVDGIGAPRKNAKNKNVIFLK